MASVARIPKEGPPAAVAGGSVYAKIAAVQGALSKVGIAKNRRNEQGSGYNFRGIDDVYAALSPLLAEHGLVIVPRMTERVVVERQTKAGGALFNVTVKADFDFVSSDDGSTHTASTYGEAMDSADKATNKAMSAAYKYAAMQAFCIPTEGDNDTDGTTHDVAPRSEEPRGMPDAEWSRLVQLLEAAKADTGAMLKHYGVSNLRLLDHSQYANAVDVLNAKLAKMAKEETDAKATDFGKELGDAIQF